MDRGGLVAGWLAGQAMKGGGYGLIGDIVVGAMLRGFLASVIFGGDYLSGINLQTLLAAFLGAIILIGVLRTLSGGARVYSVHDPSVPSLWARTFT